MSVARQAAQGVAWNMLFGVGSQILQLVGTLILARLIAPDDYGAVIAASILVVTAGFFTSFMFGQYLIARRAPPEVAIQAMALHVGIGLVAMTAVYALRHPLSEFFGTPATSRYVLGYAIAHMLDRTRNVPERLILRALRFRAVAAINAAGTLALVVTSVAAAPRWGADAIVFGVLARAVVTFVLFFRAAPRAEWLAPLRLRAADVRDLFAYGLPIMIGALSDQLATRFDNLIMARLFGPGVMGRYNLSYSLAEMPINSIAVQIGDVLMPSFSKMEDDQRRRAVVRAAALMSLVVTPLGVGLGAVSGTVVATFFDQKWGPMMAPMLALLSATAVVRPMQWSAIAYLQAVQKTRIIMYASFLRAIAVLSLVAALGAAGDENWACAGAVIGFTLHSGLTILAAGRAAGFSAGAYLLGVLRPLLACAPMVLAVLGVERGLAAAGVPAPISLAAQIAAGVVVYVASCFVLVRDGVDEFLRLGRDALRRRRG